MLIDLTPAERANADTVMPAIFDQGFHPDRIDWYTRLVVEHGGIRGGVAVIPEFIAAMILEANLENRTFGDANKRNPHFGVGWCQHDTAQIPNLDTLIALRADPLFGLQHTLTHGDLVSQGGEQTWFNKRRWHAWWDISKNRVAWERLDPAEGWSPYKAALDAWHRLAP